MLKSEEYLTGIFALTMLIAGALLGSKATMLHLEHSGRLTPPVPDTVFVPKPMVVSTEVVRMEYVPIGGDINIIRDSIVVFPIEQKLYQGPQFSAWVSGYQPALDSLVIYPVTKTEKFRGWKVGPQLILQEGPLGAQASVVADARYETGRLSIGAFAGYGRTVDGAAGPTIGASVKFDLVRVRK